MTTDSPFRDQLYIRRHSGLASTDLARIDDFLQKLLNDEASRIRQTHYFHGRFENLYLESKDGCSGLAELDRVIEQALEYCADLLEVRKNALKIGFWFNLMEPGQVTSLHRHDDYDELVSGVAYLTVPEQSGDLVLIDRDQEVRVSPVAGDMLFFSPQTPHRVEQNRSATRRLSIGMNIGPASSSSAGA